MQFEHEQRRPFGEARHETERGIVDGLVIDGRDLWLVVARRSERIEDWFHGGSGTEVAPLRVCRALGRDHFVLDEPDPECDRLLSDIEGDF